MGNCWEVLGISPTNDVEAIKKAYRALIKQWHPDTVNSDEREEYTNRSAEINVAYDDAIRLAEGWAGSPGETSFPSHRVYRYDFRLSSSTFLTTGIALAVLAFAAIILLGPLIDFLSGYIVALLGNVFVRVIARRGVRVEREAVLNLIIFAFDAALISTVFADWSFPFKLGVMMAIPIRVLRRTIDPA
jgi:hypothetical protein